MSPKRFKEIRLKLDLTQEELSEVLGVADKTVINRYEAGTRAPSNLMSAVMEILNELSPKKSLDLMELLKKHLKRTQREQND